MKEQGKKQITLPSQESSYNMDRLEITLMGEVTNIFKVTRIIAFIVRRQKENSVCLIDKYTHLLFVQNFLLL
jgi:hypothetical protein